MTTDETTRNYYQAYDPKVAEKVTETAQLIMQQIDEDGAAPTDDCECHRCIDEKDLHTMWGQLKMPISASKIILCPVCGNKRCPKASDHRLDYTNSNEPGQPGSIYPKSLT